MYAPGDVRVEDRDDPTISQPTDAIIKLAASRICGSDLWPYRGAEPVDHAPMGHVGFVGVTHGVSLPGDELFFSGVHLRGGPLPYAGSCPSCSS